MINPATLMDTFHVYQLQYNRKWLDLDLSKRNLQIPGLRVFLKSSNRTGVSKEEARYTFLAPNIDKFCHFPLLLLIVISHNQMLFPKKIVVSAIGMVIADKIKPTNENNFFVSHQKSF
jgi:hypothetical protein